MSKMKGKPRRTTKNFDTNLEQYPDVDEQDLLFEGEHDRAQYDKGEDILKKVKYGKYRPVDSDNEKEILGVADTSDEDDLPKMKFKKKKKKVVPKIPVHHDSDLDSDIAEKEDDGIPDSQAWGKKKSTYYSADYVDEDWGGMEGSDEEAAELEEQEAREIQKRMAASLDDADYGLEFFQQVEEPKKTVEKEAKTVIQKDIEKLSQKEKLDLLKKESPELIGLIEEYKMQLAILSTELQPLMKLIEDGSLPPSSGTEFVKLKFNLLMSYCTNLSFYFVLKSTKTPVKNHPVMKRLVQYKTLIKQLAPAEEQLRPSFTKILTYIEEGKKIIMAKQKIPVKKTLKILSKPVEVPELPKKVEKAAKPKNSQLTADEEKAVELYKATRPKKTKDSDSSADEFDDEDGSEEDAASEPKDAENEEMEKRGITYQIAKNKGLMPTRSKDQRNPRVKHKNKFRKANIRRKGAIRESRTEVKRYDGERSGIKSGTVKSIKFK